MIKIKETLWIKENKLTLAIISAVPVWLFSLSATVEGFPSPNISGFIAYFLFFLALLSCILFFIIRWMPLHLLLYSLTPLILSGFFDEISTQYKTPFIFLCGLILSSGAIIYQLNPTFKFKWIILVSGFIITFLLAWNAVLNFWALAERLGYTHCFPGAIGCPPLPEDAPSWWLLFFKF